MLDNALVAILFQALNNGLTALSITAQVKQQYQPTTQGTPSLPTIYLHKIDDQRYGSARRYDVFNETTGAFDHYEEQYIVSTYQINATAIQDPANTTQMTAADYAKAAAFVFQNDVTLAWLQSNDVGVLKIMQGRQTYFSDDMKRFESDLSFDCAFIHKDVIKLSFPAVTKIVGTVDPIV